MLFDTEKLESEYLKTRPYSVSPFKMGELYKIENFLLAYRDRYVGWHIHHRLEVSEDGSYIVPKKRLIELGLYYKRPASELIFLKNDVHGRLHGKVQSHNQMATLTIQQQIDLEYATWQRFIDRKKRMGLL